MEAFRKYLTINDPNRLVLSDLPFHSGQRVEVLVLPTGEPSSPKIQRLRTLLSETQAIPAAQALSDEEIIAEVETYRKRQ